jgi:hypothetical protein
MGFLARTCKKKKNMLAPELFLVLSTSALDQPYM